MPKNTHTHNESRIKLWVFKSSRCSSDRFPLKNARTHTPICIASTLKSQNNTRQSRLLCSQIMDYGNSYCVHIYYVYTCVLQLLGNETQSKIIVVFFLRFIRIPSQFLAVILLLFEFGFRKEILYLWYS